MAAEFAGLAHGLKASGAGGGVTALVQSCLAGLELARLVWLPWEEAQIEMALPLCHCHSRGCTGGARPPPELLGRSNISLVMFNTCRRPCDATVCESSLRNVDVMALHGSAQ